MLRKLRKINVQAKCAAILHRMGQGGFVRYIGFMLTAPGEYILYYTLYFSIFQLHGELSAIDLISLSLVEETWIKENILACAWALCSFANRMAKAVWSLCFWLSVSRSRNIPSLNLHDDFIKWKHFLHNWPFVRGIHWSGWIPHTKARTRSFDVFYDLRLNKRLSKQPWGWWFETASWSLWCQCNGFLHCGILLGQFSASVVSVHILSLM